MSIPSPDVGQIASAGGPAGPRVLLLVPARTYRAADFLLAAARMGLDLVVGSDGALPLGGRQVIPVNPADPEASARRALARAGMVSAVVAADAPMLPLAATVAGLMGLPHNPVEAVRNAADKTRQRQRWAAAGVPQPRFEIIPAAAPVGTVRRAAETVGFPCVVKAVSLSASQGILRADGPAAAATAAARIRRVLAAAGRPDREPLLVEEYITGPELSIDGLLEGGDLTPVAVFDKPVMTDGPTFEETLLVTPSRLAPDVIDGAVRTARHAARALGLRTWAVHAELRVTGDGPAMLELAARSIGSLCSRALRFPAARAWKSSSSPAPSASPSPRSATTQHGPPECSCSPCRARACCAPSKAGTAPQPSPASAA